LDRSGERIGIWYVALAVTLFSTTPVFIRWASPLSSLVITCLRMLIGSGTVFLIALLRGQGRLPLRREDSSRLVLDEYRSVGRWSVKDWRRFVFWGLIAALHFIFYIASLDYTTVAHSLALVYTSPIWVSLFSWWLLREPLPRTKWLGILVTLAGMAVLSGFEPGWTPRMLIGDALALGSAITFGVYSATGRAQRSRYPLWLYAGTVYAMAGLWLLPLAAWSLTGNWGAWSRAGGLADFGPALLSVLILGVFPLGIGHTLYNAALRHTHPTRVNIIATQEVTGGILLSWWLLGEVPTVNALVGALIMLIGVIQVVL
jgi:drug/metabolite transporter (DMT)-like permease